MDEVVEGTRVVIKPQGTFDAEVVLDRQVVWHRAGYRTMADAQAAAEQQLARMKQNR